MAADENGSLRTVEVTDQVWEIKVPSRQVVSQSANGYRLHTLRFCIILDAEFSNMTVNDNNNNNKKTHFFFKNRERMHRFPEHREPWGSALSSSLWSTPVLVAGSPGAQLQRNGTCRGRSPPSFTSGLWNSRPAREWMLAQQYSQ